jgi:YggT family protein
MLDLFDAVIRALRPALFGIAVALALVAAVDWMVRTRRVNPFGPVARLFRRAVDPLLVPIERIVVRAGGLPANAPWWALFALVIAGVLLLGMLGFVRDQVAVAIASVGMGPRGVYRLVVTWVVSILQMAIIARVVMSWIHFRPGAWYVRWAYRLSEPILRPIRNMVPLVGTIDISPILGWLALGIAQALLLRVW